MALSIANGVPRKLLQFLYDDQPIGCLRGTTICRQSHIYMDLQVNQHAYPQPWWYPHPNIHGSNGEATSWNEIHHACGHKHTCVAASIIVCSYPSPHSSQLPTHQLPKLSQVLPSPGSQNCPLTSGLQVPESKNLEQSWLGNVPRRRRKLVACLPMILVASSENPMIDSLVSLDITPAAPGPALQVLNCIAPRRRRRGTRWTTNGESAPRSSPTCTCAESPP